MDERAPLLRSRALAVVVALALGVAAVACSSSQVGDGFRLSESQLTAQRGSGSVTPRQPGEAVTTTVAAANGPDVEVFAQKPGSPAVQPAALGATALDPIPRDGLNSAGTRKTATGWSFTNPTYYGHQFVLMVTADEGEWLKVQVPARPNGQEGWVRRSDVTISQHDFHGELKLSDFTLRIWQGDEPLVETQVVIGTERTPTPQGRLYINEVLPASAVGLSASGSYGPFILGTSSYSESLDLFDSGLPVIAFHGTNAPGLIGTRASNGCVRMPNEVVTMLAETLPAGTPIDVVA